MATHYPRSVADDVRDDGLGGEAGASRPARRRGVRIGRIGGSDHRGFDIVVSPSWFLSVALIVVLATPVVRQLLPGIGASEAGGISLILAVLLALSVLLHELGHCLAARIYGIRVREVRLYLVGGVSELDRSPATAGEEALIAGAGPAVSAMLAAACWLLMDLAPARSVGWLILIEMAIANAVVAVFNILPALPLDGGRVARAVIWKLVGRRRLGTIVGVAGGFLVSAALVVWAAAFATFRERPAYLQAAILVVMAGFVAAGAWSERPARRVHHLPPGVTLSALARRAVHVGSGLPLSTALALPSDAAIVVTAADGHTIRVLDRRRAARRSGIDPATTSWAAATPLEPEMIVLPGDEPSAVVERIFDLRLPFVALMRADGTVDGVVTRTDIERSGVAGSAGAPRT